MLGLKILGESTKSWANPALKSMVLTVIQKFVVLYNNYLFAAKFLLLILIIFLWYLIFDKGVGVGHFTENDFTDNDLTGRDLTDKKFSQNKL